MSQTDKAMELAEDYTSKYIIWYDGASDVQVAFDAMKAAREALRAHIESMQRDCRTCKHIRFSTYEFEMVCRYNALAEEKCINHDKYRPMPEFKQLTRS